MFSTEGDDEISQKTGQAEIANTFARDIAAGLVALAAKDSAADLSPTLRYWRAFACRYLAERCQMTPAYPAHPDQICALDEQQTVSLLRNMPPMRGAEYLSPQGLNGIWLWLDDWVCTRIRQHGNLGAFLENNPPRWHQVGRVCFHLAENKQDQDYPFAFMATYAPELPSQSQGQIRHQPLGRALQEYAGARNKQSIIVAAGLRFGALKSGSRQLADRVDLILSAVDILSLEAPADRHCGELRHYLTSQGTPIGPNDMLIAAHALSVGLTIIAPKPPPRVAFVPQLHVNGSTSRDLQRNPMIASLFRREF